jgi:hypothetical protein
MRKWCSRPSTQGGTLLSAVMPALNTWNEWETPPQASSASPQNLIRHSCQQHVWHPRPLRAVPWQVIIFQRASAVTAAFHAHKDTWHTASAVRRLHNLAYSSSRGIWTGSSSQRTDIQQFSKLPSSSASPSTRMEHFGGRHPQASAVLTVSSQIKG